MVCGLARVGSPRTKTTLETSLHVSASTRILSGYLPRGSFSSAVMPASWLTTITPWLPTWRTLRYMQRSSAGSPPVHLTLPPFAGHIGTSACRNLRSDVTGSPTMVTWRDVPHRHGAIARRAAPQPALYTAVATGLTGLTTRTRLRTPTHRLTSRGPAVASPPAGAGPSVAQRGPAGHRPVRL